VTDPTDLRRLAEGNIWRVSKPSDWHREMRGKLIDAGIDLHEHTDATLALCDAEVSVLRQRVAELEEQLKGVGVECATAKQMLARIAELPTGSRGAYQKFEQARKIAHAALGGSQ
jgi:hypothetical protein